jgi:hypothetical protein
VSCPKSFTNSKFTVTEDGFRIEITGNKEAIRRMLCQLGPFSFFSSGTPFAHGFQFGFGPGFWSGLGGWWNPWEGPDTERKPRE